jgi:hypothetical protein
MGAGMAQNSPSSRRRFTEMGAGIERDNAFLIKGYKQIKTNFAQDRFSPEISDELSLR